MIGREQMPLVLVAAALACGCADPAPRPAPPPGGGPGSPDAIEVRTSTLRATGLEDAEETLAIGAVLDDPAREFGFVSDVAEGPRGRMHVADGQAARISVFDSTGSLVRHVGGEGEGPGEFSGPMELHVGADGSLRAFDLVLWRESVFDPDGANAGTTALPQRPQFGQILTVAYDARGELYDLGYAGFRESLLESLGGRVEGVGRGRVTLDRWRRDRGEWRTLAEVPSIRVYFSGGGLRDAPFAPRPLWDAASGGGVWYADSRRYVLTRLSADGDTTCRVRIDAEPPQVSGEDRDAYLAADDVEQASDDRLREIRQRRREMPIPDRRPALEDLLGAEGGGVWVLPAPGTWSAPPDTAVWHVYSGRGQPVARVRLPRAFHPMRAGPDVVLGVRETRAGVDQVVRYEVEDGGDGG